MFFKQYIKQYITIRINESKEAIMSKLNLKNKKLRSIIGISGFLAVSAICVTSVSLSSTLKNNNAVLSTNYLMGDHTFNSYLDLENYIQQSCLIGTADIETRNK